MQMQLLVIINNESKVKKFSSLQFNVAKILVSVDDVIKLSVVRFHFFLHYIEHCLAHLIVKSF